MGLLYARIPLSPSIKADKPFSPTLKANDTSGRSYRLPVLPIAQHKLIACGGIAPCAVGVEDDLAIGISGFFAMTQYRPRAM